MYIEHQYVWKTKLQFLKDVIIYFCHFQLHRKFNLKEQNENRKAAKKFKLSKRHEGDKIFILLEGRFRE